MPVELLYFCFYNSKGLSTIVLVVICVPKKPLKMHFYLFMYLFLENCPQQTRLLVDVAGQLRGDRSAHLLQGRPLVNPLRSKCLLEVLALSFLLLYSYIKQWKYVLVFYFLSTFFILNQLIFSIIKIT